MRLCIILNNTFCSNNWKEILIRKKNKVDSSKEFNSLPYPIFLLKKFN